jgi:hypothetical protein
MLVGKVPRGLLGFRQGLGRSRHVVCFGVDAVIDRRINPTKLFQKLDYLGRLLLARNDQL